MTTGNQKTVALEPPRVFSEFKSWLQVRFSGLSKSLQCVAVFVLQNPDIVALNTVSVISKKAKVPASTMIRFAKSIGYQGFSDMQAVFQSSMQHVPQPYAQRLHHLNEPSNETTKNKTLLHSFSRAAHNSLDMLEQHIDEDNVLKASKQLARAKTIYIAGQGRATPVKTYLHYTFIKMGIQAVILEGMEVAIEEQAHLIQQDEVLLAISFSPYTAPTRKIVDICLAQQVPVLALTDSTLSPIARNDDLHLEVLEEELGGIRGLSATMCLALCLAVETGKQRSKATQQIRPD